MKIVINKDEKLNVFFLSAIILLLNIILGKEFYQGLAGLIVCTIASLLSLEFNFVIYVWGLTGFFGLQLSGTDNFAVIAVLVLVIRLLIENKGKIVFNKYEKRILFFSSISILLLAVNIVVSYVRWGQPFLTSIIVNRKLLELLGIPLYAFSVRTERMKIQDFEEFFSALSSFFCMALLLQFFLRGSYELFPVQYASRYTNELDRILFHNYAPFLCLLAGLQLFQFLENYEKKKLIRFLLYAYMLVFVAKGRMLIIAMLIVCVLILFLYKGFVNKWIKNLALIVLIGLILASFMGEVLSYISNVAMSDIFSSHSLDESYVRVRGIKAYFDIIPNYTIFGGGVYSSTYLNTKLEGLVKSRLYLSDIGIFGDVFNYGIFAVIVLFIGIGALINIFRRTKKKNIRLSAIVTMVIILVTMWSVPFFTYIPMVTFVIVLYVKEISCDHDKIYF